MEEIYKNNHGVALILKHFLRYFTVLKWNENERYYIIDSYHFLILLLIV